MASRGPYAKGIAKRAEILDAALHVIAESGYNATSIREIAVAVDLTDAGVLHYFASREELLVEVLRRRDALTGQTFPAYFNPDRPLEALVRSIRENADQPGLVQLYAQLSTEAADPRHPAFEYFRLRNDSVAAWLSESIRHLQDIGQVAPEVDPARAAVLLVAATDGLQTLHLYEPSLDMAAHVEYLSALILGAGARVPQD